MSSPDQDDERLEDDEFTVKRYFTPPKDWESFESFTKRILERPIIKMQVPKFKAYQPEEEYATTSSTIGPTDFKYDLEWVKDVETKFEKLSEFYKLKEDPVEVEPQLKDEDFTFDPKELDI